MINKLSPLPEFLVTRFKNWKSDSFVKSKEQYKKLASFGQSPSSMVISCCDSRVHATSIFGADAGEFFIHRNIANLVPPYSPDGENHGTSAAIEYATKMENCGAGELLVTSMDRDGTQKGYDNDLLNNISSIVNIPIIASGGVGNLDHLVEGIKIGKASAVLAASIFHYGTYTISDAKKYLNKNQIPVRI